TGKITNWSGQTMGTVGVKLDPKPAKWRTIGGNDYYLRYATERLDPAVIVDTVDHGTGVEVDSWWRPEVLRTFEQSRACGPNGALIMPHTERNERFLDDYAAWVSEGRPGAPERPEPSNQVLDAQWDPEAAPDPIRYVQPVPVEAELSVTGYMQDGAWCEASPVEA